MKNSKFMMLALLSSGLLLSACGEGGVSIPDFTGSQEDSSNVSGEGTTQEGTGEASLESTETTQGGTSEESLESTEGETVEKIVVGKRFVGIDIEQKDFVYYDAYAEVMQAMSITFEEDGSYYLHMGKTCSGSYVMAMDMFYTGTYEVGEENIVATPDYLYYNGNKSEVPAGQKDANKSVFYWGEDGRLRMETVGMTQEGPIEIDAILDKEDFTLYTFDHAFAEPTGDTLPEGCQEAVNHTNTNMAGTKFGFGNKGTAYLRTIFHDNGADQDHVIKYEGALAAGENDGEWLLAITAMFTDGQPQQLPSGYTITYSIGAMENGYKLVNLGMVTEGYTLYHYFAPESAK